MVFDKTGTLTEGEFGINRINVLAEGIDETTLLSMTAALEQQSQHPIAQGIVPKTHRQLRRLDGIISYKEIKVSNSTDTQER